MQGAPATLAETRALVSTNMRWKHPVFSLQSASVVDHSRIVRAPSTIVSMTLGALAITRNGMGMKVRYGNAWDRPIAILVARTTRSRSETALSPTGTARHWLGGSPDMGESVTH